ncbi:hypothetical protein ACLB2K_006365 [Fragaria x ananassa]
MKKPILMIWLPVVAVLASWTLSATAASVGALGIGEPIEPLDKGGVEWGSETNAEPWAAVVVGFGEVPPEKSNVEWSFEVDAVGIRFAAPVGQLCFWASGFGPMQLLHDGPKCWAWSVSGLDMEGALTPSCVTSALVVFSPSIRCGFTT